MRPINRRRRLRKPLYMKKQALTVCRGDAAAVVVQVASLLLLGCRPDQATSALLEPRLVKIGRSGLDWRAVSVLGVVGRPNPLLGLCFHITKHVACACLAARVVPRDSG